MLLKNKTLKKILIATCSVLMFNSVLFTAADAKASELNDNTYLSSTEKESSSISYSVVGTPAVGNTVDIVVNLSNVSNLYGASLDFAYNDSLIQIKSVQVGSLFYGKVTRPVVNSITKNKVSLAASLHGIMNSINGSGSIAVIKAKVLKAGNMQLKTTNNFSNLSADGLNTCVKLSNSSGQKINYSFTNKSIDFTDSTEN